MTVKSKKILISISFISALILAVSFVLPAAEHTRYVDASGKPLGLLDQLFHNQNAERITTYGYFWEDMNWIVPLIFFLPLLLIILAQWGTQRSRLWVIIITPFLAAFFLITLWVMVSFADFGIFPGIGGKIAYGGYISIGALAIFLIVSVIQSIRASRQLFKSRLKNPKDAKI